MRAVYKKRLNALADQIEVRHNPLGVGLKNQCWAGLAHSVASSYDERVTDYFGITFKEMKVDVKANNECSPTLRNKHMAMRTRLLAESR